MSFGEEGENMIASIAGGIAAGVSPVTLAEACLARIEARNGQIRAMIHVDAPAVLESARRAEREMRNGLWRGPLHGVPVAVKDNLDVAGWPTRLGSRLFGQSPASRTADCLVRLQERGAVLIGKTNMHELCAGGHANPWFGKVVNPLDPGRGTGGTSSGAAAAVAAGFCVAAIGTDTGGSNRSPAAATGLYGYKPGQGLISTEGVCSMAPTLDSVGVLARSVADTRLIAEALSGRTLSTVAPVGRLRIALCPELAGAAVDAAVSDAMGRWLDRPDVDLVEIRFPEAAALREAGLTILLYEFATGYTDPILASPDLVGAAVRSFLDLGLAISPESYCKALATRQRFLRQMPLLMAGIDALAIPTCPGLAPRLEDEMTCVNGEWLPWGLAGGHFRRWANMLDMPALAIPLPLPGTLPASVQLGVLPGQDARLFDLAEALTQH
ncbi:amidase [Frigidibacter sp.]|uniref:amidase n=1 Tax=Frigidibacter sp. TaxID=2586418 RepID=UPI0027347626|nr:amidase [Frigidibacter sp.]MDP3342365.1 amidase [Frigidibacter sp.]